MQPGGHVISEWKEPINAVDSDCALDTQRLNGLQAVVLAYWVVLAFEFNQSQVPARYRKPKN